MTTVFEAHEVRDILPNAYDVMLKIMNERANSPTNEITKEDVADFEFWLIGITITNEGTVYYNVGRDLFEIANQSPWLEESIDNVIAAIDENERHRRPTWDLLALSGDGDNADALCYFAPLQLAYIKTNNASFERYKIFGCTANTLLWFIDQLDGYHDWDESQLVILDPKLKAAAQEG